MRNIQKSPILLLGFILWGVALACRSSVITPTPFPPPATVPSEYQGFPLTGMVFMRGVDCSEGTLPPSTVTLWESYAQPPGDPSSTNPVRGNVVTSVRPCEMITAHDYAWSGYEQEFWILVETEHGITGWMPARTLVLPTLGE
jgi:hypothetical protein